MGSFKGPEGKCYWKEKSSLCHLPCQLDLWQISLPPLRLSPHAIRRALQNRKFCLSNNTVYYRERMDRPLSNFCRWLWLLAFEISAIVWAMVVSVLFPYTYVKHEFSVINFTILQVNKMSSCWDCLLPGINCLLPCKWSVSLSPSIHGF